MAKITDGHTCRTYLLTKKAGRRWACNACGARWICRESKITGILGTMKTQLTWHQIGNGKL